MSTAIKKKTKQKHFSAEKRTVTGHMYIFTTSDNERFNAGGKCAWIIDTIAMAKSIGFHSLLAMDQKC